MKSILKYILVTIFVLIVGCATTPPVYEGEGPTIEATTETPQEEEAPPVNIAVIRGPTALAILPLMDRGPHNLSINIYGSPDEVVPQLVQGSADLAAVPTNLASVLYNNTGGGVQVVAIHTLGVLHVVSTTEINTIEDLRGQTVFLSGLGGVVEFAFNYVLEMNGLTPGQDITLDFRAEHTEIAALIEAGQAEIALLPEPFATTVVNMNENARFSLDLTEEWNNVQPNYALVMGVMVGRREFLEENPGAVAAFLEEYEMSINFINSNVEEGAALAVKYDIIPNVNIAAQAIPRANIVFVTGDDMQTYLEGFLEVLYNQSPGSIGGQLPSENFFFVP